MVDAQAPTLSILDLCRHKGFEVAIFATYNVSFPLFENVVLRALQSAGCRQVILLADAVQVAEAFEQPERRPTRSGLEYLLIPVQRSRTFHPKLLLQLGRNKTRAVVGSHNLTMAGYGRNLELTSPIEVGRRDEPQRALIREIWSFVRAWIADQPEPVRELFDAARVTARNGWIGAEPAGTEQGEVVVRGSAPTGPSLFTRLRDWLPAPVERVSVLGPYFDSDLALLAKLRELDGRPEVVVAVHPDQAELSATARACDWARFVDLRAASLGAGKAELERFVHAKALVLDHVDGTRSLVTGSANPSRAAWLTEAESRNAELIVLRRDAGARIEALGLGDLAELPALDDDAWELLATRERLRVEEQLERPVGRRAMTLAWLGEDGVVVASSFVGDPAVARIELLDQGDVQVAPASSITVDGGLARIRFAALDPGDAVLVLHNQATGARAVVQQQAELTSRASGSARQQFRTALLGLETDGAQLEDLFKLVSKVLEDPLILNDSKPTGPSSTAEAGQAQATAIKTFAGSMHEDAARKPLARRQRALAASSDLAAIIEFLIYQLGIGRTAEAGDESADVATSEEELADVEAEHGADARSETSDEDQPDPPPLTGTERAQLCQRKVQTLLKRLRGRMQALAEDADPLPVITQTVAVLGLLRHLRRVEPSVSWRPRNVSLLPAKAMRELFVSISPGLYAPEVGLVARALESQGGPFDELSTLHALTTWLAADCGVDLAGFGELHGTAGKTEQLCEDLGRALGPLTACSADEHAEALAFELANAQSEPTHADSQGVAWLRRHLGWARTGPASGGLTPGALVSLPKLPGRHVVVRVEPNKVGVYVLARGRIVGYRPTAVGLGE